MHLVGFYYKNQTLMFAAPNGKSLVKVNRRLLLLPVFAFHYPGKHCS